MFVGIRGPEMIGAMLLRARISRTAPVGATSAFPTRRERAPGAVGFSRRLAGASTVFSWGDLVALPHRCLPANTRLSRVSQGSGGSPVVPRLRPGGSPVAFGGRLRLNTRP